MPGQHSRHDTRLQLLIPTSGHLFRDLVGGDVPWGRRRALAAKIRSDETAPPRPDTDSCSAWVDSHCTYRCGYKIEECKHADKPIAGASIRPNAVAQGLTSSSRFCDSERPREMHLETLPNRSKGTQALSTMCRSFLFSKTRTCRDKRPSK